MSEKKKVPYARTVFVCTNKRDGGRVACANPGRNGERICEELKAGVKAFGLRGRVRVARSGCLDLCEKGPNLFVFPDGDWHCGVTLEQVPQLLKELSK